MSRHSSTAVVSTVASVVFCAIAMLGQASDKPALFIVAAVPAVAFGGMALLALWLRSREL